MKNSYIRGVLWTALAPVLLTGAAHAASLSDDFSVSRDYLTNGVTGTIWDGVYFGAGEFSNSGVGGGGPGETLQCDADITDPGTLTLQTTGTAWEFADDDGFFLYKVVRGDFSVVVHVVSPFDNTSYNTAGLQARAFESNGDPLGGSENFVSWTRFDNYNFANYLRNQVNGVTAQINPGDFPNNNYWLRMDRVGDTFRFYQKSTSGGAWQLVSFPSPVNGTSLNRPDLAGEPLQVGIIHATYDGQLGVQFTDFNITATNFDSWVTPPSPVTGLVLATNNDGGLQVSWTPGAGSSGSLVAVWDGTNGVVKQRPVNGSTYVGDANYGAGEPLAAAGHFVVYAGSGTGVTVSNLVVDAQYNVAVFSYAGVGDSIAYNLVPATASVTIPPKQVVAQLDVQAPDVTITFSANPGKWYWLQSTEELAPADWHNVVPGPVLANSVGMVVVDVDGALAAHRYYRLQQLDPDFKIKASSGAITSLKRTGDVFDTEYVAGGKRLGDINLKYRQTGATWLPAQTVNLSGIESVTYSTSADGTQSMAHYLITNGLTGTLALDSVFTYDQDTVGWTVNLTNLTGQSVEIGDLALPLPMNTSFSGPTTSVLKHSLISGHGSFIFWMRGNSVGPYLVMTPEDDSWLEYWDVLNGGYEVYVHSLAAGSAVAAQGTIWRQPNTSLTLSSGGSESYTFKFQWADDYDGVRQALVDEGQIDVHVVPGMTVPTNLPARLALRTTQTIDSVQAEFPVETQIQSLGSNGAYQLYQVDFAKLGENRLTVNYGGNHHMFLEFFVTEPVETLVKKRAAFLVDKQVVDPSKWYDGLYAEWNMSSEVLVTPDNYDLLVGFVRYEVAADDSGLSRPAYLAIKNAVFPVQSEVTSLDRYIEKFVWGGLQRTTNETYPYGIYGVQDWYSNRNSGDTGTGGQLHLWRIYDYPHIVAMYEAMYRVAKYYPGITTALSAQDYLQRAYGTANALFTVPLSLVGWSAYQTGLMNELVIVNLIDELEAEGMASEAATLRAHWEQKVNYFVTEASDLFGSEYAFDSTGFETQQALARYAMEHGDTLGATNPPAYLGQARQFMDAQMAANIFARGWLETAYYYYGSDYRSHAGNDYVLSYMSQMGGWGVLDYGLYFATNATDYLRLGYASYLSAWALMNTGTPESGYGYWYPGAGNDGACGGGFEPAPSGTTWLGQPHHRGSWYYSCEENLGFCGAIRSAATILADDPIFGRFCYGGLLQQAGTTNQITPLDGVRQRFHAMLGGGDVHLELNNDHFAAGQPIVLLEDLSDTGFAIETSNPAAHDATLRFSTSIAGAYTVSDLSGTVTNLNIGAGEEVELALPIGAGVGSKSFSITR